MFDFAYDDNFSDAHGVLKSYRVCQTPTLYIFSGTAHDLICYSADKKELLKLGFLVSNLEGQT